MCCYSRGDQINRTSCLIKRNNPHTIERMATEEHDNYFKQVASIGLGVCEIKKRRSNTEALILKNIFDGNFWRSGGDGQMP